VYFDPKSEIYKTLTTKKATVQIVGDAVVKKNSDTKIDKKQEQQKKHVFKKGEIDFINQSGSLLDYSDETIVNKLLALLLFLLGWLSFFAGSYWLYRNYIGYSVSKNYLFVYLQTYYFASTAYKNKDIYALYKLLKQLGQQYGFELQGQEIQDYFKELKLTDNKIEEWNTFVHHIERLVFSDKKFSMQEKQDVLKQAMSWLKILLACCRLDRKKHDEVFAK